MEVHVGIKGLRMFFTDFTNNELNTCWDRTMTLATSKFQIDMLKMDDILHDRHGNYEEDKKSMSMIIKEKYGEPARKFVEDAI